MRVLGRTRHIPVSVASLVLFAACGGGSTPAATDAGTTADATADAAAPEGGADLLPSGAMLAAPAPPALPSLTPCPMGWREVPGDATTPVVCDPWPAAGQATCPDEQAHFPGTPGCATLGPACPTGDFPTDLPAGTTALYVRAGATAGDGSATAPFGTIGEATAAATAGSTIVVAAGDYDEPVVLPQGVSLRGACVADVRITHSVRDDAPATVQITGTGVTVTGVRIAGARSGLLVDAGADATVDGVLVDHATETGLRVHMGGHAVLRDVAIRNTQIDPDDHASAFGLVVELGGTAEATHLDIASNALSGVVIDGDGSMLTLDDSVVRDTQSVGGMYGAGLGAQHGGHVLIERSAFEHNRYFGVGAVHSGVVDMRDSVVRDTLEQETGGSTGVGVMAMPDGQVTLSRCLLDHSIVAGLHDDSATIEGSDLVIRSTQADSTGNGGPGIFVVNGATATLQRVLLDDDQTSAVYVTDPGTHLSLMDATVRGTRREASDGQYGRGVQVQGGAALDFTRLRLEHNRDIAFMVSNAGTTANGSDLAIADTFPELVGGFAGLGIGLSVQDTASLTADRVSIDGSEGWGALVTDESNGTPMHGHATLNDLRITGTGSYIGDPVAGTRLGRALEVQEGASAEVTRGIFDGNRDAAVMVIHGSSLSMSDAIVRNTESDTLTRSGGRGIEAFGQATIALDGVHLDANRELALSAYDDGTTITGTNIEVRGTRANECAQDSCSDASAGMGVGAYDMAHISLTHFVVTDTALCGVQVTNGAGLDLAHGEVSRGLIGANVQDPAFDIHRLEDDVVFEDNQSNLDATILPVPEPSGAYVPPTS